MASTFMNSAYQWLAWKLVRLGCVPASRQQPNRRPKPDVGRLSNHLRRDIGLGSDA